MLVNIPKEIPLCYYALCVDDGPSTSDKPIQDWVKKGEIYTVYAIAKALNSSGDNDTAYFIKDSTGKKIEAHDGVPTWRADRFELMTWAGRHIFEQYLN